MALEPLYPGGADQLYRDMYNMKILNEVCPEHNVPMRTFDIPTIGTRTKCPICMNEEHQARKHRLMREAEQNSLKAGWKVFETMSSKPVFDVSLPPDASESRNWAGRLINDYVKDDGKIMVNYIAQGSSDSPRSAVLYKTAEALNDRLAKYEIRKSAVYINIDEIYRKIKRSWNDPSRKFEESTLMDDLARIDYLFLDGLGQEAMITGEPAKPWQRELLQSILANRKTTVIGTGMDADGLKSAYGPELARRIINRAKGGYITKIKEDA